MNRLIVHVTSGESHHELVFPGVQDVSFKPLDPMIYHYWQDNFELVNIPLTTYDITGVYTFRDALHIAVTKKGELK